MNPALVPYVYRIQFRWEGVPLLFPTLDAAVQYLIENEYSASRCLDDCPVYAHVAGSQDGIPVDLTPYIKTIPVNEAALRAELAQKVEDSREDYARAYPNGRIKGHSLSGEMRYLCEKSGEELEGMLRNEVLRRSRQWKEKLINQEHVYPHDVCCNASRRAPIGNYSCICVKKTRT